jgi:alcohol dehydrogenase
VRGDWSYPTEIRFGAGRVAEIAEACMAAGIRRPLLVTDATLKTMPMIAAAQRCLDDAGLDAQLFAEVRGNPAETEVAAGLRVLRERARDGVVAFGGGSALDVGKVLAFMAGQSRPMWDFEDVGDHWRRADAGRILPIVAVPTTAGTGSEVGRAGVITELASRTKRVIFHPRMLPRIAILDPELTVGLPPSITAATGIDAFVHCLEAYCAPGYHPLAEGIAVEGIRLVKTYLPRAFRTGTDLEARGQMLAAAAMGATAFQKGLGAVHALAHPLGALYDTHHGLTNGVFLPYVLLFNRSEIEEKIDRLARWLGLARGFDGFFDWILELRKTLGIPHRLAELGIGTEDAERVAGMAVADPTASGNPRRLDAGNARRLFEAAVHGDLRST